MAKSIEALLHRHNLFPDPTLYKSIQEARFNSSYILIRPCKLNTLHGFFYIVNIKKQCEYNNQNLNLKLTYIIKILLHQCTISVTSRDYILSDNN